MKAAFTVLALGLVSAASAYFHDGQHDPKEAFLAFAHAGVADFSTTDKKFVVQFNTCNAHKLNIHEVELMQFRGKAMAVKKIVGGAGNSQVGLELSEGEGIANFEFKIWAKWDDNRAYNINHEDSYKLSEGQWKQC